MVNIERAVSDNPAAASAAGLAGAGWWVVSMANVAACGSGAAWRRSWQRADRAGGPSSGWVAKRASGLAAEGSPPRRSRRATA